MSIRMVLPLLPSADELIVAKPLTAAAEALACHSRELGNLRAPGWHTTSDEQGLQGLVGAPVERHQLPTAALALCNRRVLNILQP